MTRNILILALIGGVLFPANGLTCTDIVVGKKASADGSVITSHTGASRNGGAVQVVPAQTHEQGSMAPVYWGMLDAKGPFESYGEVIGHIPQVERTYRYFHSAYSHMNEHQLAIAETTMSQRKELVADHEEGARQIMTIEQAQAFALQRCKTAHEAVGLIGSLVEKYGFLPSAHGSEALAIADPNEAWVMEVFAVGPDWDPKSGELGAIWAAQRVPDDHVTVIPNWSVIKEIDLGDQDSFMASSNYMQVAIDNGWYDPQAGRPFVWQDAYSPPTTGEPTSCSVSHETIFLATPCCG